MIESTTIDVPRGDAPVVWNVLGAAPVYLALETYSSAGSSSSGDEADPEIFCGQSLLPRKKIDYAFTSPPKSISTSKDSGAIVKSHLGVEPGGAKSCIAYFGSRGEMERGARLAIAVARATQLPVSAMSDELDRTVDILPTAEMEAFAKETLARDDGLEAHRLYQSVLLAGDQRARAIAEYDARLAAKPSADAEYLALRVRSDDDDRRTIDAVVARYPVHAYLRRAQAITHYARLELAETAAACDALRKLDAALWRETVVQCIDALVAVERGDDAA